MDSKDIKSLLSSLGFILFYVFATAGIVKLFWNTKDEYRFEGRIKFLVFFQILFSLIFIISIYHIVGPYRVDAYYFGFLMMQLIYVVVGIFAYFLIKQKQ